MAIPFSVEQQYQQAVQAAQNFIAGNSALPASFVLNQLETAKASLLGVQASDPELVQQYVQTINSLALQVTVSNVRRFEVTSAGEIIGEESQARAELSQTLNPESGPFRLNAAGRIVAVDQDYSVTNADPAVTANNFDFGLDARVRPISETQSVRLGDTEQGGPLLLDPNIDGREEFDGSPAISTSVGGRPGVGAGSDDVISKNPTRVEIDNVFNEEKIIPQPNVLDQYASYSYVASLYLMNATDYRAMIQTKQKNLRGAQLLVQSGGAPVGGRNQFFSNDYYIERIELKSAISGKGTNAAHNVNTMRMTIVEPNGITFLGNLDRAVQQYLGSADNKKKNFASQMYLLVIRFYGYDDQGNLVRGGVPRPDGTSDPNAFVEKWYPMQISKIDFKVANKLVEYEIEAATPKTAVNVGTNRGSIPYNVELAGVTVKDALAGPAQYSSITTTGGITVDDNGEALLPEDAGLGATEATVPTAPAKANTAPSKKTTIRQGLMAALNEYQLQLVKDGIYTYPDTYTIEFVNPSLEQAVIKNKGSTDKSKVGNSTTNNAADKALGVKQSADTNSKIETITAGTQIVQVIDKIIRNSSYLEDQQIVIFDPVTQKERPNGAAANNLAYFKIGLEAIPKQYDPKRNDYAYEIKYTVNIYRITEAASNYFFIPTFKGVHKQYNYWFTGENTQVLNYEQNYNAMYTSILSGGKGSPATYINDKFKFAFAPRSPESSQGADGKVNEPKANLADFLFNPADLANATLTIVGDPAWLQQGEAFAGIRKNDPYFFRSFLADGTINFESQEILFEILINAPRDYDLSTGLIDPNSQTTFFQTGATPGAARQSYVYKATECVSEFNKGKFTQTIKGVLRTYYPDQTLKANQQIALELNQDVIRSLSQGRQNASGAILGGLSTPAFLNNLPTVASLFATSTNFGLNPATQVGNVAYNILGSQPTRTSPVPNNPTSFGLAVGTPVLNSINFGAPNNASLATPNFVGGADQSAGATTVGTSQTMAASDDSGTGFYDANLLGIGETAVNTTTTIDETPGDLFG